MTAPVHTKYGQLPAAYQLTQSVSPAGQTIFTAEVPLRLVSDSGMPSAALDTMWMNATQCLQAVQPYLLGPQGEQLNIILSNRPVRSLNPQEIVVTERDLRAHSRFWKTSLTCAEQLHEILHLLGLIDTYKEEMQFAAASGMPVPPDGTYDCRAQGPKDSIMSSPQAAFMRVGLPPIGPIPGMSPLAAMGRSLLYPIEFTAITAPNCQGTQLYSQCAANAYRTSNRHGCQLNTPSACYDPAQWYLTVPGASGASPMSLMPTSF